MTSKLRQIFADPLSTSKQKKKTEKEKFQTPSRPTIVLYHFLIMKINELAQDRRSTMGYRTTNK